MTFTSKRVYMLFEKMHYVRLECYDLTNFQLFLTWWLLRPIVKTTPTWTSFAPQVLASPFVTIDWKVIKLVPLLIFSTWVSVFAAWYLEWEEGKRCSTNWSQGFLQRNQSRHSYHIYVCWTTSKDIHLAAAMTQKHLLEFIMRKHKESPHVCELTHENSISFLHENDFQSFSWRK